jgi:aspartate-semialdehyde dehydrogenase
MRVGIIGSTGLVGRTTLRILEERGFPVSELTLFASERSAGEKIEFKGKEYKVQAIHDNWDLMADVFFTSVSDDMTRPILENYKGEALVIDKSKIFRMNPQVPLVVPEVNADALKDARRRIVANPNCTTIPFVMALAAVRKVANPTRTVVTSLQSVSGGGKDTLAELILQREYAAAGEEIPVEAKKVFPKTIAANVVPLIGSFSDSGETGEEAKLRQESRKILGDDKLKVYGTCVRVPVEVGHSLSVTCIFEEDVEIEAIRESLSSFAGMKMSEGEEYVTPFEAAGKDEVFCSRLRYDVEDKKVIHFWLVSDNLRKGAALNAVQIAEHLFRYL